ncbi:DUF3306 domain-containing protein [Herminiimonas arsenitoxidans]|uniref:DUF3306 domain-containing protein n=1 Tax=Herminiimonas arsenitoxidans TaxID=1809410 RepID=UPI0009710051|nr:DUF3306 domain-containing protein [Herminiimonas arsenitoxidans]
MAAEDFFARWAKKKSDASEEAETTSDKNAGAVLPASDAAHEPIAAETAAKPLPTQEDVEHLTHDSDYSAFMGQGVDESVKRSAMKKLFTNPHFNVMDGLDVYIEDYSKFEAMTPAFIATLSHAKALLDPLSQLQSPFMNLLEVPKKEESAAIDAEQPALDTPQEDQVQAIASEEPSSDGDAEQDDTKKQEKISTSKELNASSRVEDI